VSPRGGLVPAREEHAPFAGPPAARPRFTLPSWAIAAIVFGWLTIVALLLAVLIDR
jgi:hypothetical protein